MRRFPLALGALVLFAAALTGWEYRTARADPMVRTATIGLPDWPAGAAPVRVALLSDIHIGNATMDAARLMRIAGRVAALHSDLVLIAGDFIAGHSADEGAHAPDLVAPLRAMRPRLGIVAVPGNHDHWTDAGAVARAVAAAGGTMLVNRSVVRGPLAIAGIDDAFTHHDRAAPAMAELRRLAGARVVLTHSPDLADSLPPDVRLVLAGHTHCGQVVLPFVGPVVSVIRDRRVLCGMVPTPGRLVVVGAGLGTSSAPLRLGAVPDLWLLTLGPVRRSTPRP